MPERPCDSCHMKWRAAWLLVLAIVAACSQDRSPGTTDSNASLDASFVDTFDRADTARGTLGEGWDLRGPYSGSFPLPPAGDGFISNGTYTYAGDDVVYAARKFRGTVRRIGTIGRFRRIREGDVETTLTIALTSNNYLVSDMVHLSVNRGVWELTVRRGAGFEPVSRGNFSPPLALDQDYVVELEVSGGNVTVRVPGREITSAANTTNLLGEWAFWEEYVAEPPAGVVFDFDAVWADEEHAGGPMP